MNPPRAERSPFTHSFFAGLAFASSLLATGIATAADVTVTTFSPEGLVKDVQQVTARFSAPMVPFGDLRDVAPPFRIDCKGLEGATASERREEELPTATPTPGEAVTSETAPKPAASSRWIDSATWAHHFARPVPAGVRCTFTLRDDLRSHAGSPLTGRRSFTFSTGAPAITRVFPYEGSESIEEGQVFLLGLDGEVDLASVREHAGFAVDGLPERVEADLLEGKVLDDLLANLQEWDRPEPPLVALRARRAFPNGKKVTLLWGPGIRSTSGESNTVAQAQVFQVREAFSVKVSCRRENARAGCIPITPISIEFSAPISAGDAAALRLVAADGREQLPTIDEEQKARGWLSNVEFRAPFAENTAYSVRIPEALRDDAGRALRAERTASLSAKTGPLPALAKFSTRFGIVESEAGPALPVTLRNVEAALPAKGVHPVAPPDEGLLGGMIAKLSGKDLRVAPDDPKALVRWLRRVAVASRGLSIFDPATTSAATPAVDPGTGPAPIAEPTPRTFTLPKPNPAREAEVVGIPLEGTGLHVVELASPLLGAALLGDDRTMYVPAAALVTNLAVHFKRGRESSLAWVTTLDDAEPVAGALVTVHDCDGNELAKAESDELGVARFDALPGRDAMPNCWSSMRPTTDDHTVWSDMASTPALNNLSSGLFVIARTEGDMSFVHTSWNRGLETWRFDLPDAPWNGPAPVVHTIFDRPLYRAGETAHFKFLARSRTMEGFAVPEAGTLPKTIALVHSGSDARTELPFAPDERGIAVGEWAIPAGAKLGRYDIILEDGNRWIEAGSVRVEQFRVPLVRGEVALPTDLEPAPSSIHADVSVRYLSGGSAARLPVLLRSELRPAWFEAPDELEGFTFASGPLREDDEEEDPAAAAPKPLPRVELELDAGGAARATITALPTIEHPTDLVVEAEFRDPNGEVQTVASSRTLWPSSHIVGIRVDNWVNVGASLKPRVVVLDLRGKPFAGAAVRIEAAEQTTISHRKRLIGGFYGYDHRTQTRRLGPVCEGVSDANGMFTCDVKPAVAGRLVLEATVVDQAGRRAVTNTTAWVSGSDSGFETEPSDRIDLVPEKPAYEAGEIARLQVRFPFREATALVTVEREGVGEARVVHLNAEDPVIEVPIRGSHAPNVFVSVLLVRGRVGDVQPTSMVDLGRPAYRLGIAELRVDWKQHRLGVEVQSDREVYAVREKAKVHVRVRRSDGSAPAAGSEVAVTAVDEGLLELSREAGWDPLTAMMGRRPYEVATSTAQAEVVGKRHYGRKAVAGGGGGGRGGTRELFDTLLFWSPRVVLDAEGEADVEVPLNDSLTGFRIVAVATGDAGEFGSGETTIRSTRELSMLSGLPPVVRGGDEFGAEFTLRNTGDRPLTVKASGTVTGAGLASPLVLEEKAVTLAAGQATPVTWTLKVPRGGAESAKLTWEMSTTADGGAEDRLKVTQNVATPLPVRVVQSTLEQLDGSATTPVRLPAGADPADGGITVSASAKLGASVEPLQRWLASYRYTCLEQRVSVAIGREDEAAWKRVLDGLASHIDGDGLLRFYPGDDEGDDRLTAYVLSITHASRFRLPADVEERVVNGLRGFVNGSVVRHRGLSFPDLTFRKLSALEALARAGKADASALGSLTITPELWPTSAVLDWWSFLTRVAIPDRDRRKIEAEQVMRSRLNLSGTTFALTTEDSDALWWMMASPDSNATRLLLYVVTQGIWKEDAPRLLKGILARRRGGAWSTTVANAWGVLAMRAFTKAYEKDEVRGRTEAALGEVHKSIDWSAEPTPLELPWPASDAALTLTHEGSGKPWITTTASAATPFDEPVFAGYRITKTVTPIEPRTPGLWSRGDRVKVRLDIEAERDLWWVVIDDPIPAGASHLGTGLGRGLAPASTTGSDCEEEDCDHDAVLFPDFVERTHESWRAYLGPLYRGRSHIEYTIRLNQAGIFQVPPTRIEALYAPEIFGETPNTVVKVEP